MGIEIQLIGNVHGALFNKKAPKLALDGIRETIDKEFPLTIWARHPSETGYSVSLFPIGDPVKFELDGKHIILTAPTSVAGPGYHAAIVDLTQKLTVATHVKWHEDESHKDETGYYAQKDFSRLKSYFTRWLRHLCLSVDTKSDFKREPTQLCLPGIKYDFPGFALTPLGPRTKEWVATVASGAASGEDFWPWPEQELSAEFYVRYALTIMWNLIDWHPAQTNRQKTMMLIAHESLVKAFSLDPRYPTIPWKAWKEICDFLMEKFPSAAPIPLPEGEPIGYVRHKESQVEAGS